VITFTDTSVAPCSSLGYKVHRCGDTLFPGGVGKTSSPENFNSLLDDVSSRLFDALPDDTWFYPGHGDDSTLGEQKPHLRAEAPPRRMARTRLVNRLSGRAA
jgi:glyoxylase-like metal-dependent hydrolase (beta-lactamase superfamily II)